MDIIKMLNIKDGMKSQAFLILNNNISSAINKYISAEDYERKGSLGRFPHNNKTSTGGKKPHNGDAKSNIYGMNNYYYL